MLNSILYSIQLKNWQGLENPTLTMKISVKDTDVELLALFGILYYSAIFKSYHEDLHAMFPTDGTGRDIFRASMSLKRVLFLLSYLRFDDKNNRQEMVQIDKSAVVSWLFNEMKC